MSTKIDDAFATLRILIADTSRDLAMAMAELRSVAAERDNFAEALQRNCTEYVQKQQALIAERDKLKIERDEACVRADFADLAAERRGAELDKFKAAHQIAVSGWNAAAIERDNARQSLRAAEADAAETESVNSDLRTVNARLVADLAAAMERLNHAESIIMQ